MSTQPDPEPAAFPPTAPAFVEPPSDPDAVTVPIDPDELPRHDSTSPGPMRTHHG